MGPVPDEEAGVWLPGDVMEEISSSHRHTAGGDMQERAIGAFIFPDNLSSCGVRSRYPTSTFHPDPSPPCVPFSTLPFCLCIRF
ncbi:hypothetical protein ACOMHN_029443 [Nucella lapillus]